MTESQIAYYIDFGRREAEKSHEATDQWKDQQIKELREANAVLRRIMSFVPAKICIEAKEQAGFPNYVTTS